MKYLIITKGQFRDAIAFGQNSSSSKSYILMSKATLEQSRFGC